MHLVVHLTNIAVQKTAPDYDPEKGSKWSLRQLRQYLIAKHGHPAVTSCNSRLYIHVGRTLDKQFEPIFSHCLSKFSWVLAVSLFYRWRDVLAKLTRYLSKVPRVFSVLSSTTSTASRCTAMTSCWMPISNRQSLYFVMFALICQTFLRFPNDIELK